MSRQWTMRAAVLAVFVVAACVGWSRPDKSLDGALFVGDGPGDFMTVQSAVNAAIFYDMPRTVYVQAGKTFNESIHAEHMDCASPISIDVLGNGFFTLSPPDGEFAISAPNCVETVK